MNIKKLCVFTFACLGCISMFGVSFAEDIQNPANVENIEDPANAQNPEDSVLETKVITFKPTNNPQGASHFGYCFASSVALERSDAWRCKINNNNSIYDPCFSTSDKNKVICDVDPLSNKAGFTLRLIKLLPAATSTSLTATKPWILILEDGSTCTPFTGTMPIIPYGGKMFGLKYGCVGGSIATGQNSGIIDGSIITSDKTGGPFWLATKIIYLIEPGTGPKVIQAIPMGIKTVWQ